VQAIEIMPREIILTGRAVQQLGCRATVAYPRLRCADFPRNKTALDQGRRIAISFAYGQILGSRK
jgi:hypothetical protein